MTQNTRSLASIAHDVQEARKRVEAATGIEREAQMVRYEMLFDSLSHRINDAVAWLEDNFAGNDNEGGDDETHDDWIMVMLKYENAWQVYDQERQWQINQRKFGSAPDQTGSLSQKELIEL